ncbi:hypothetical protein SALBM135S_03057 [Streptomyces alboniger]
MIGGHDHQPPVPLDQRPPDPPSGSLGDGLGMPGAYPHERPDINGPGSGGRV